MANDSKNQPPKGQPGNQVQTTNQPKNSQPRAEARGALQLVSNSLTSLMLEGDVWNKLKAFSKEAVDSGLLPKAIDSPQKAFVVALKGHVLGIDALTAWEEIAVINGKTSISGKLMLRLIEERCVGATIEWPKVENENLECRVVFGRPNRPRKEFRFTLAEAKAAGLLDKSGPWRQYPRVMLRWRAVAEGARIMFPDVIGGAYTPDELGVVVEDGETSLEAIAPAREVVEILGQPEAPKASAAPQGNQFKVKALANLMLCAENNGYSVDALKALTRQKFPNVTSRQSMSLEEIEAVVDHMSQNPIVEATEAAFEPLPFEEGGKPTEAPLH